jgi:hypothetical protein
MSYSNQNDSKPEIWFGKDIIYIRLFPNPAYEHIKSPEKIKIDRIFSCAWENGYYNIEVGIPKINNYNRYWQTDRNKEFEAQFPEFPYYTDKLYLKWRSIENTIKINTLEHKINEMENHMAIIISHFETLMTVLGTRLPTDDPLELSYNK